MAEFFKGCFYFFKGIGVIYNNNLWKFIIIPACINLFLGISMILLSIFFLNELILDKILSLYKYWINSNLLDTSWIYYLFQFFSFIISSLLSIGLYIILYTILFSIIILPFLNSLLDELEILYLGKNKPSKNVIVNTSYGIYRSIKSSIIILVSFLLSLLFGPFQPFVLGFIQGYFLGKETFYFMVEKDSRNIRHQELLIDKYRGEIVGLGFTNFMFLFIPIIGLLISPAASICGAFLLYYKKE